MKKILHFITNTFLAKNYICFMNECMPEYEHFFVTGKKALVGFDEKTFVYNSFKEVLFDKRIKRKIEESDKIIVSGLFAYQVIMLFWSRKILSKAYVQFWGGDFYSLNDNSDGKLKSIIMRKLSWQVLKRISNMIFLIPIDVKEFARITGIVPQNFWIATFPPDPKVNLDYSRFYSRKAKEDGIRILVGNSATSSNCHIEIFKHIKKYDNGKFEVICPLSYGDGEYAEEVITAGKEMFGDRFKPIRNMIEIEEYFSMISGCSVGVYGFKRQQGMGNICALIGMGKKVFLKEDCPLLKYYQSIGLNVYSFDDISTENLLIEMDENKKEQNREIMRQMQSLEYIRDQWIKVFES